MYSAYESRPPIWRTVKDWDAEVVQHWYSPRSELGQIYDSFFVSNEWTPASVVPPLTTAQPLFRMGSMSQGASNAVLAWVENLGLEQTGGGGQISVARVASSTSVTSTGSDKLRRPVAIANKPGTDEVLMAYQAYWTAGQQPYVAGSDLERVCFRRSFDGGQTWSAIATCDQAIMTRRYGLSAAYDPYSDAFLVGYIADSYIGPNNPVSGGEDDFPAVAIATVPASGSSTPYQPRSIIGGQSLTAPSIACNGAAQGCRVVWDDNIDAALTWSEVGVDPTTGTATAFVAYQQGYLLFDAPSVAYNPDDDSFKLALCQNNDAIYAFTMGSGDTTWTGIGDVWNDPHTFVSAAVVSIWPLIPTIPVTAWFPRFI
jgi:hypothetical protein